MQVYEAERIALERAKSAFQTAMRRSKNKSNEYRQGLIDGICYAILAKLCIGPGETDGWFEIAFIQWAESQT